MVDNREPSTSTGQHNTMARGPGGQFIRSQLGPLLVKSNEMLGESSEQNLGEVGSILNDPVVITKARQRMRRLEKKSREMFPETARPGAKTSPRHREIYRRRKIRQDKLRKGWLDSQVQFFLRTGRSYADLK